MAQQLWFSADDARIREALDSAFSWCEGWSLVADAPTAQDKAAAFWERAARHAERGRVVLSKLEVADAEMLRPLQVQGRLRRPQGDNVSLGHFAWFERGSELRFVMAPHAHGVSSMSGPGLWMFWEGSRDALPEGLQSILEKRWASSEAIAANEPLGGTEPRSSPEPYSRPIPSVREVLGTRSVVDLFELDEEAQERALWSALLGEGAIDLDQAIRLCAERLRAQGFLDCQALRQDGRIYTGIEARLLAARRGADLFDRPRNGFVRAVQPNLEDLTAEQWRDCLMGSIAEGARVDRDEAVRLGFDHARAVYGVTAQRLRAGGRADQALRSAINSCVRQSYLARDGAAYLVRVAPVAAPTLRGVLATDSESPPSDHAESAAAPTLASTTTIEQVELLPAPAAGNGLPEAPQSPLDRSLDAVDLPTRMANWADRREIHTLRQFLELPLDSFVNEKNLGRRSLTQTRERLETLLGCTWEEAHQRVRAGREGALGSTPPTGNESVDTTTETLTAGGAAGWDALSRALTDDERNLFLLDVNIPTRMKGFIRDEGLERVGDLFRFSYQALAERPNLGRKSLNDTLDAVRDAIGERTTVTYESFLDSWHGQLAVLEPVARMVVTRRAGMHGTRETLEELAGMLGVTRERVRQIETRVIERLAERTKWRRTVEARLQDAFGASRAIPLALLAQDAWWSAIDQKQLLLDFVVRRIFEDQIFMVEAPSGKHYLTKFRAEELLESLERAKQRVAKLEFPVELTGVESILRSEAASLDPIMYSEFDQSVRELLHLDPERPELALGFGRHRSAEVIAFLNSQEAPVPIAAVEERCGRGHFPDEVLYFKRGIVGLKRHFPDFDGWMAKLVPAAIDVMRERPAGRQWLVPELHDALRERDLVPEWLGHWHLASLLRVSGQVDYLGRLRVASQNAGREQERLQYEELFESLLEDAGGPLAFDDLLARARTQTDVPEAFAKIMVLQAPFARLDATRVGLIERDIPGGPAAVAAAIEAVVHSLNTSQQGMTPHQAMLFVNALSGDHASWSRQLVVSVLRSEPSLRIDRSKNIGLDEWDDARCPTQSEFLRREVQNAGGVLPIRDLYPRFEAFYGRAPDRGSLGVLAREAGIVLNGDMASRPVSVIPDAMPPRAGINLAGIPTELREMFEELVQEPLSEPLDLRSQITEHVEAIEKEYRVNEFVDLRAACVLGAQCQILLDSWESLPLQDRHLVNAAVRYFVSWDDVENDFDIGGLDDDKQIVGAVLSYLGMLEASDGASPT